MPTTTFYPSSDGNIRSFDAVFATARNAGSGTLDSGAAGYLIVRQFSGVYDFYEEFLNFDTSVMGFGAIISSAFSRLYGGGKVTGGRKFNVYGSNNSVPVSGDDFDQRGATAYCDTDLTDIAWSTSGWNTWIWNSIGLAAINPTGQTKICYREVTYDVNNTAPAGGNIYVSFLRSPTTGTSQDPCLEVTYTEGGNDTGMFALMR